MTQATLNRPIDVTKIPPAPLFADSEQLAAPLHFKEFPADAEKEYRYACDFLQSYIGSSDTFKAYRRELERLMSWTWRIAKKSLRDISRADYENYIRFCQRPPSAWIGTKQCARFIEILGERKPNPDWRPFVMRVSKKAHRDGVDSDIAQFTLSQSALRAIFAISGSFFNYLIQEDYLHINPVGQIRQKSKFIRKQQQQAPIRRLSDLQWSYVIETVEQLANSDPEQHERSLFVLRALYAMYLRVSELTDTDRWSPTMGDFAMDLDGNWWFTTVGKGNKERRISVSNELLQALKRYRRYLGLTDLPTPGETTPLITKVRGVGAVSTTRGIRKIVQHCFDAAIAKLQKDGFLDEADNLQSATVHWLRHTGISDDVKTRPREHVRDDAGHGSSAITDRYIDVEMRSRHASARHKKINPDA